MGQPEPRGPSGLGPRRGYRCTHALTTAPLPPPAHHVTVHSVQAVRQALQGQPLDRQFGGTALTIVVPTVDLPGESKVSHTHCHVFCQPGRGWRLGSAFHQAAAFVKPGCPCPQAISSQQTLSRPGLVLPGTASRPPPSPPEVTYMQLRAARSRWMKLRELRYSMPQAMSTMNRTSVCSGRFWWADRTASSGQT